MTNHQKLAEHHLNKAERWQWKIEKYERRALEIMTKEFDRWHGDKEVGFHRRQVYIQLKVNDFLKNSVWYRQAVANRNSHQTQSQMYSNMALMEAQA